MADYSGSAMWVAVLFIAFIGEPDLIDAIIAFIERQ